MKKKINCAKLYKGLGKILGIKKGSLWELDNIETCDIPDKFTSCTSNISIHVEIVFCVSEYWFRVRV